MMSATQQFQLKIEYIEISWGIVMGTHWCQRQHCTRRVGPESSLLTGDLACWEIFQLAMEMASSLGKHRRPIGNMGKSVNPCLKCCFFPVWSRLSTGVFKDRERTTSKKLSKVEISNKFRTPKLLFSVIIHQKKTRQKLEIIPHQTWQKLEELCWWFASACPFGCWSYGSGIPQRRRPSSGRLLFRVIARTVSNAPTVGFWCDMLWGFSWFLWWL